MKKFKEYLYIPVATLLLCAGFLLDEYPKIHIVNMVFLICIGAYGYATGVSNLVEDIANKTHFKGVFTKDEFNKLGYLLVAIFPFSSVAFHDSELAINFMVCAGFTSGIRRIIAHFVSE